MRYCGLGPESEMARRVPFPSRVNLARSTEFTRGVERILAYPRHPLGEGSCESRTILTKLPRKLVGAPHWRALTAFPGKDQDCPPGKAQSDQSEKKRNRANATVVTPDPISVSGSGSAREKKIGTATTTHPMKAINNEMSRGTCIVFAWAI